jgi:hypothetical protein
MTDEDSYEVVFDADGRAALKKKRVVVAAAKPVPVAKPSPRFFAKKDEDA